MKVCTEPFNKVDLHIMTLRSYIYSKRLLDTAVQLSIVQVLLIIMKVNHSKR